MADRALDLYLDGTSAGRFMMTGSGNLTFEYDEAYRTAPGATPLSLSMPKVTTRHRKSAALPFIQGPLPDNEQALASLARTYHVSANSPFAILEHVGRDVAGALQLVRPGEASTDATADRRVLTPISDDEVAHELATVIDAYRTGRPLTGADRLRMSLAGAQPKIALARMSDGAWARAHAGAPTTHILKPEFRTPRTVEDERFPDLITVELLSLAVARHVGLRTPDTAMWTSPDGELRALVVQRYDRHLDAEGMVRRDHQEDLCQAMAVPPGKKYQYRDGGPGVAAIGELLRGRLAARDRFPVARDFLALLTLNIALVNTDAHAKNYSLLLDGESVRLAPAYDVLSIAPYEREDASTDPLTFPMRIGNSYRFAEMFPSTIAAEGQRLGLTLDESQAVVEAVLSAVPGALEAARDDLVDLPGARAIADATIANLRRISPLHERPDPTIDLATPPRPAPAPMVAPGGSTQGRIADSLG